LKAKPSKHVKPGARSKLIADYKILEKRTDLSIPRLRVLEKLAELPITHIRMEVSYRKGGSHNMLCRVRQELRGYWLTVGEICAHPGPHTNLPLQGYRALICEASRFSAKRLDEVVVPHNVARDLLLQTMRVEKVDKIEDCPYLPDTPQEGEQ